MRRSLAAALVCLLLAVGPGARAAPPGPSATEEPWRGVRFLIGVYHLPRAACDPKKTLERWAHKRNDLALLSSPPRTPPARPSVWLSSPPIADFAPPDERSLKFFGRGLSAEEKRALPASKAVTVLAFAAPAAAALSTYRLSLDLGGFVARECGGVIWDDETRLAFSQSAWAERSRGWSADGLPDVSDHIAIHMYRDGELIRMITLGMAKLGLPDVVVNQVPSSYTVMEDAIVLLCQRMVEGARPVAGRDFTLAVADLRHREVRRRLEKDFQKNALGRAVIHLAAGKHDKGDPENPLLELVFPGRAQQIQEQQSELLTELFGGDDRVLKVEDDPILLAASARARKRALLLKPRYTSAPPLSETLQVKAPFKTSDGGTEWMWVEVVRWQGATIHGVLRNDPFDVPSLKSGSRVDVEESTIFDYILTRPDGSREGNETGPLLEARQR
jgi:uncharacterized protein YegJ (DUF2314 family)